MARDLKLVVIGAGWIVPFHLDALDRLGRTALVGVASARAERAAAVAEPRGAVASADPIRLLEELRPDVAYVCVPPVAAVALGEALVERGIPFLIEKPLAALDAEGPVRLERAIAERHLVVGVGYHLRGLDGIAELRRQIGERQIEFVAARWLDGTPDAAWWRRVDQGGGQVIEQATHLYDIARHLVGEAEVLGARSVRADEPADDGADVADATVALLRFDGGAIGTFSNSRRHPGATVDIEFAGPGVHAVIARVADGPGGWEIRIRDETGARTIGPGRDPYEAQAEAFLDAVEAGDPTAVLSTYADALGTDRLTRAVVAATGERG